MQGLINRNIRSLFNGCLPFRHKSWMIRFTWLSPSIADPRAHYSTIAFEITMEPGPISSQERCSNSSSAQPRFLGKARIAIHGQSADLICERMRVQKLHWQSWLPFHYCNGGGFRLYSPANSKDLRRKPFYRSILFDLTLLNVLPPPGAQGRRKGPYEAAHSQGGGSRREKEVLLVNESVISSEFFQLRRLRQ